MSKRFLNQSRQIKITAADLERLAALRVRARSLHRLELKIMDEARAMLGIELCEIEAQRKLVETLFNDEDRLTGFLAAIGCQIIELMPVDDRDCRGK